jgi:hypothetical protein
VSGNGSFLRCFNSLTVAIVGLCEDQLQQTGQKTYDRGKTCARFTFDPGRKKRPQACNTETGRRSGLSPVASAKFLKEHEDVQQGTLQRSSWQIAGQSIIAVPRSFLFNIMSNRSRALRT